MIRLRTDITSTFKYFKDKPVLREEAKEYVLEGKLHCYVEGYEDLYDVFNVVIVIPFNFPNQLPIVIEKDGKIPRRRDYHMDKEGKCCLGTKIALFDYMHSNNITSFCEYFKQIIIIHFFQMKHFMVKGRWFQQPEAHYTNGLIDSYKRIFNISENELKKGLSRKFKRFNKCLCKSNRRFDKCHGKYIPCEQIKKDFNEIIRYLNIRT